MHENKEFVHQVGKEDCQCKSVLLFLIKDYIIDSFLLFISIPILSMKFSILH